MTPVPFTRPTIIAAVSLIDRSLSQAVFNHLVLRLRLENEITSDTAISVSKKADKLGRIVVQRAADPVAKLEGTLSLAEAVIREAVQVVRPNAMQERETAFARGLARMATLFRSMRERDRRCVPRCLSPFRGYDPTHASAIMQARG